MSRGWLLSKLIKAGYDPDSVADLDRSDLLNQYAEYLLAGEPEKIAEAASNETTVAAKPMDFDFQKKMFEFEVMKYQQERGTVKTRRVGKTEVGYGER